MALIYWAVEVAPAELLILKMMKPRCDGGLVMTTKVFSAMSNVEWCVEEMKS